MLSWYYVLIIACIYSVGRFLGNRLIDLYESILLRIECHIEDKYETDDDEDDEE